MALAPGTRFGPYEIIAPLGAGGMGEVYRARDTKLGREVALKILPDLFVVDPDRRMRFEREARTLAALNHPHVAHVYGIEESGPAIIMELVDGEELASRLARGPLAIDDAVAIAQQVASGLEAAHERGIIHRDLKPANIKLRPDGTVKVLDFGLAKGAPITASGGHGEAIDSPTITSPALTLQGIILGTAAYMAPEQAKGKAVDKRADVWALGCVLFEMLTATRAFDGEDVSDTLAIVLRGEPDWSALPPATPQPLRTLLRRCLERDWRRRVSDMSVVRFILNEVHTLDSSPTTVRVAPPSPPASRLSRIVRSAAAVAVFAAAVVAAVAWWRPAAGAPRVTKFTLAMPGQSLAFVRRSFDVSPDGSQFVFVSSGRLFLRDFSEFEAREISATDIGQNINTPTFSPDGASIAFHSGSRAELMRVSVRGGAALRVCDSPAPLELSWSAEGILAGQGRNGIRRCPATGTGPAENVVTVQPEEQAFGPQLLPGGDALLFTLAKTTDGARRWDSAAIVVQSLSSGERKVVHIGGGGARYAPSGHLVYAVGGVVFAVGFDVTRLQTVGEPWAVLEGVRRFPGGSAQLAISNSGVMVYMPGPAGASSTERTIAIGNRDGTVTRIAGAADQYVHVRASRDGARLLVGTDDGRDANVWMYRLDGAGAMQRITIGGNNRFPVWSPDGRWVVFQSDRGGDLALYRQRMDGADPAERLTTASAGESHIPESWSPDGRHLSFAIRRGLRYTLHTVALGDKRVTAVNVESGEPTSSTFSPDGKWLAYTSGTEGGVASPNRGVYVQPFPPTGAVYQAPRQILDFHPVWSPRGDELLYVASATSGQMVAVSVSATDGLTFGAPVLFPSTVSGDRLSGEPRAFDILPDGRLVGITSTEDVDAARAASSELRVVLNWFEELKQRATGQ